MVTTPPQRRRPEARPDEILEAALAVFGEQGFAAARVEDIAKRAGLSKGAVYLYFPSKEAMLNALVERSAGALARSMETYVATEAPADPETTLRGILRFMLTAMNSAEISAAPRLVLTEAQRFPELATYYREHVLDIARRSLCRLLEIAIEQGVFREVDIDAFMRVMAGPGIVHMAMVNIFSLPPQNLTDPAELADAISDILLHGLKPRPKDTPS